MLKIKDQFKDEIVAFGGTGAAPLGKKSQEELIKLAIIALKSDDKQLLNYFDGELPSLRSLQQGNTKAAIDDLKNSKQSNGTEKTTTGERKS